MTTEIDLRPAHDHDTRGRAAARGVAPQSRVDARKQLAQAERFGEVVVGADLEAQHLVYLLAARGEHDDGLLQALAALTAAEALAVAIRQHHVEQNEIRLCVTRLLATFAHAACCDDAITLHLEIVAQPRAHGGIVFDDQYGRRHHSVPASRRGKISSACTPLPSLDVVKMNSA